MAPPRNPSRVKAETSSAKSWRTQLCDNPVRPRPQIGVHRELILPFSAAFSPFCSLYPARFSRDGREFLSAIQYVAFAKAILFHDRLLAEEILRQKDAEKCRTLGRKVEGFSKEIWEQKRYEIMHDAVYSKFDQNPDLKAILMSTGNGILVEASSRLDWGAGLGERDRRIKDPKLWPGQNLLGKALMEVRMEFLVEAKAVEISERALYASVSNPEPNSPIKKPGPELPIWNAYWSGRPRPTPPNMILVFREGYLGTEDRKYPFRWKGKRFLSVLQYLYYCKAELTADPKIQRRLLEGNNGEYGTRLLGRRIRPVDSELWRQQVDRIVFEGVYARFSQNGDLKQRLLDTDEALLCYADDDEWGVGMTLYDKQLNCPSMWKGPNRLGNALMTVRDMFREEDSLMVAIQ